MKASLLLTTLAASVAAAQTQQMFHFQSTDSLQSMQETVNAVRTIGNMPGVAFDSSSRTMTVQASAADLTLASWIFQQTDQSSPSRANQHLELAGETKLLASSAKAAAQITRIYSASNAILARGSDAQISAFAAALAQLQAH